MDVRPLDQIVAAIEAGAPLAPAELALIERFAAVVPVMPDHRRNRQAALILEILKRFGPRTRSVNARAVWLAHAMDVFTGGADWKRTREIYSVSPPFADPLRALQWRLAKLGPLPKIRTLTDIIAGVR